MGHACSILTFEKGETKEKIQAECDEWGSWNCDPGERGGCWGGLGGPVRFTSQVYETYEEAEKYLDTTFGNYRQTAVRYKKYPKPAKDPKEVTDLERRIKEYTARIADIDAPHYKGVKQATVKCKKCGSSLATEYCGKTYYNSCPVCRTDLRPQTLLDRRAKYAGTVEDLRARLLEAKKNQDKKSGKQPTLCWAVACEVHC